MKKWEKNHLFGQFSKGGTGIGTHCSILTSVRMLAITCSFLIRFELFKLLVNLDFKENQTS